jgi:hypothetical protein
LGGFFKWLETDASAIASNVVWILLVLGGFVAIFVGIGNFIFWLPEILPAFPTRLRIPAIALLVVGFHFTLLAS